MGAMNDARYQVDGLKVALARHALPRQKPNRPVSQAGLASMVGCHWVTVSNVERGRHKNMSADLLFRFANALHTSPEALLAVEVSESSSVVEDEEEDSLLAAELLEVVRKIARSGLGSRVTA